MRPARTTSQDALARVVLLNGRAEILAGELYVNGFRFLRQVRPSEIHVLDDAHRRKVRT